MILEFVCFRWVPKCCWWFAWRGQCGRGQNIVLVCKYYASLLHPGVSEPGFEPFISPDLHFSLICVVAVKIIAVVPVHACVCVSVTLHTPNVSVQESQPLPMNWLWNIARVYLQSAKMKFKDTRSQDTYVEMYVKMKTAPTYACLFTHATTSLASLSCLPACSLEEAGLARVLHT